MVAACASWADCWAGWGTSSAKGHTAAAWLCGRLCLGKRATSHDPVLTGDLHPLTGMLGPLPWWGSPGWGAGGSAAGSPAALASRAGVGRTGARGMAVGGWPAGGRTQPPAGRWGAWAAWSGRGAGRTGWGRCAGGCPAPWCAASARAQRNLDEMDRPGHCSPAHTAPRSMDGHHVCSSHPLPSQPARQETDTRPGPTHGGGVEGTHFLPSSCWWGRGPENENGKATPPEARGAPPSPDRGSGPDASTTPTWTRGPAAPHLCSLWGGHPAPSQPLRDGADLEERGCRVSARRRGHAPPSRPWRHPVPPRAGPHPPAHTDPPCGDGV